MRAVRLVLQAALAEARRAFVDEQRASEKIHVRTAKCVRTRSLVDVVRLEAMGNYVRIITADEVLLMRGTLRQFAGKLADKGFVRTHKSHLVNIRQARGLSTRRSGMGLMMADNNWVPVGRAYKKDFLRFLQLSG